MAQGLQKMALQELVRVALGTLRDSTEAVSELARRLDPTITLHEAPEPLDDAPAAGEIFDYVPRPLRSLYRQFRDEVLALDESIESRPAPLRNGRRVYEGFSFEGRNRIYANLRKGSVKLSFELPADSFPEAEVVHGGGRDWKVLPFRNEKDLRLGLKMAEATMAAARGGI